MTFSILRRIEKLEKMLESEVKRRKVLEDWIKSNFDFDVGLALGLDPLTTSEIKPRRMRSSQHHIFSNEEIEQIQINPSSSVNRQDGNTSDLRTVNLSQIVSDNNYEGQDSDSDSSNNERSQAPKKKARQSNPNPNRNGSGRNKLEIWNEFRIVPNPSAEKPRARQIVYCKKCGSRVSPEAGRLKTHLSKCKGQLHLQQGSEVSNLRRNDEEYGQTFRNPNQTQPAFSNVQIQNESNSTGENLETISNPNSSAFLSSTPASTSTIIPMTTGTSTPTYHDLL